MTTTMSQLGYEEDEDEEEYYEDEYDDDEEGDDDDDDLRALPDNMNTGSISIMSGKGNNDPGSQYAYSAIIPGRAAPGYVFLLELRAPTTSPRSGWGRTSSKAACPWAGCKPSRRSICERSGSRIGKSRHRIGCSGMGKGRKKELEKVEEFLLRWAKAHARRNLIRCERIVHGLEYVERQRVVWYKSERQMYEADHESVDELTTEGREYMVCRMEQHKILAEEAEDRAKNITVQDFSQWMANLFKGDASTAEVMLGSPWLIQEAAIFAMEHP